MSSTSDDQQFGVGAERSEGTSGKSELRPVSILMSSAVWSAGAEETETVVQSQPVSAHTAAPSVAPGASTTEPEPEPEPEVQIDHGRLTRTSLLGTGGMAEIHRAFDNVLNRNLAMKILHGKYSTEPVIRTLFLAEAQVTAQLDHPGIPPVHELGVLESGRPYFTMKEVRGVTLAEIISAVHNAGGLTPTTPGQSSIPGIPEDAIRDVEETAATVDPALWNQWRMLSVFQRICESVAYAHARGVIHCDLKPTNIMVGAFGEVMVMDWGVALLCEEGQTPSPAGSLRASNDDPAMEPKSFVGGTPAYMPPEQAMADLEKIGPQCDVYALGVMLYEMMVGRRPYKGNRVKLFQLSVTGNIPRPEDLGARPMDPSLWDIISKAMAPSAPQRFKDAAALAAVITAWREGAMRREQARESANQAKAMLAEAELPRDQAAEKRRLANELLAELPAHATAADKAPAWTLMDEASQLDSKSDRLEAEAQLLLRTALTHADDLKRAHNALARVAYERLREAEDQRDWNAAARYELQLEAHNLGRYDTFLAPTAPFSLQTQTPCEVVLSRCVSKKGQLVPEPLGSLGPTPIRRLHLELGSYLVELRTDDGLTLRYPIRVAREQGWSCVPPSGDEAYEVPIPRATELGLDDIFVPAGWCLLGGDQETQSGPNRKEWVDSFIVRRNAVTYREFSTFLATPEGRPHRAGALRDGLEVWHPDWPVVGISYNTAVAYAAWYAAKSRQPWRLPQPDEWEKAARGVDGRFYPWGDFGDAAFAHVRDGGRLPSAPVSAIEPSPDLSPYLVHGMGGNALCWCEGDTSSTTVVRGGSWMLPLHDARVTSQSKRDGHRGYPDVGIRLFRSF